MIKTVTLDDRERATVLAALRFWQADRFSFAHSNLRNIASDNGRHKTLVNDEIDGLCERVISAPNSLEDSQELDLLGRMINQAEACTDPYGREREYEFFCNLSNFLVRVRDSK